VKWSQDPPEGNVSYFMYRQYCRNVRKTADATPKSPFFVDTNASYVFLTLMRKVLINAFQRPSQASLAPGYKISETLCHFSSFEDR